MSPLRAFGLLLLLACLLAPSALGQEIPDLGSTGGGDGGSGDGGAPGGAIPSGGACGNRDTCESGYICLSNECQSSLLVPDSLEGTGNTCSESDCCREGLSCFQGQGVGNNTCLPIDASSESIVVPCGGPAAGNGTGNGTNPEPIPVPGLPLGAGCSNWDTCEGGICLSNKCVALNNSGEVNGAGNVCSATNCCPSGLTCGGGPVPVCLVGTDDVDSVSCEVGDDNGGNNGTNPVTGPGEYAACDGATSCGEAGLICIANRCVRREWYLNTTEGLGNRCDQTNCCPNNLTCSLSLGLCRPSNQDGDSGDDDALLCGGVGPGPVIPDPDQGGAEQSTGDGVEPLPTPGPDQGGVDQSTGDGQPQPQPTPQPTVPEDGVAEGGACDNSRLCAGDLRCLGNRCQSGVDLPYGYGNACSADNCCYRGQVCVSEGNVCAPQQTQNIGLNVVQCNGAQPEPVDGSGDDLNDRGAASAIGVSSALLALLALAGAFMAAM